MAARASFFRKFAGAAVKAALALLLLFMAATAGAYIWLRGDQAPAILVEKTRALLAGQGLDLRIAQSAGPLPQRLYLGGIELYDEHGPLVRLKELELRLHLGKLLSGVLAVDELRLEEPEIIRLPESAPKTEEAPGNGIPVLPIDIVVADARITNGRLHSAALQGNAPPAATAPAILSAGQQAPDAPLYRSSAPAVLEFSTSAKARLAGEFLTAELELALLEQDQGLRLSVGLDSSLSSLGVNEKKSGSGPSPTGDMLRLDLKFSEYDGGLVHELAGLQDFGELRFSFSGQGPVTDWSGAMIFAAAPPASQAQKSPERRQGQVYEQPASRQQSVDAAALNGRADITLRCASGSLWRDLALQPAFALSFAGKLAAAKDSPFAALFADPLQLQADVTADKARFTAELDVQGKDFSLSVADFAMEPGSKDETRLTAQAQAKLANVQKLATALSASPAPSTGASQPFPLQSLAIEATASALLSPQKNTGTLSGRVTLGAGDENYPLNYTLAATQAQQALTLESFNIQGLGLLADVKAELHLDTLALKAKALLNAPDGAEGAQWQSLLAVLAGYEKQKKGNGAVPDAAQPFGGDVRLEADLYFAGQKLAAHPQPAKDARPNSAPGSVSGPSSGPEPGQAQGAVRLTANSLRWPSAQLAQMFGDTARLSLLLSGGAGAPYALRIEECAAGVFTADGSFSVQPGAGTSLGQDFLAGTLQGAVTARLANLAPLTAKGGSLEAALTASGLVRKPDIDLRLSSPELDFGNGRILRGFDLRSANSFTLQPSNVDAQGSLEASLASSPGGPVSLKAQWLASLPAESDATAGKNAAPTQFTLTSLRLHGAGLEATGSLDAALAPQASPALNGSLAATVASWEALGKLAGMQLSGKEARLDIRLDTPGAPSPLGAPDARGTQDGAAKDAAAVHKAAGKQTAQLTLRLPALRIKNAGTPSDRPGPPLLRLRNVSLEATISDMFGAPGLTGSFASGPGRAAFLNWRIGEGHVTGADGRGDFFFALRRAGRSPQKSRAGAKKDWAELLTLAGAYDLHAPLLRFDTLTLRDGPSRSGLTLKEPLVLNMAQGIELKNANIVFEPAGELTANIVFSPESMRVAARLTALPFGFFSLFGVSGLPDGIINADADFSAGQGASASDPQGNFSLLTRMSATQSASGLARDDNTPLTTSEAASNQLPGPQGPAQMQNQAQSPEPGASAVPPVFELSLAGRLKGSGKMARLTGEGSFGSAAKSAKQREGTLSFQIPLQGDAQGLPAPDSNSPLSASVHWNGPAQSLWQAVPLPDTSLSGPLLFDAAVSGSLAAPKVMVKGYMAGGRFEDAANGLLIRGIDMEAANAPDGDIRVLLAAKDRQSGSLAAELDLKSLSGSAPNIHFRSQFKAFKPLHRDDLDITLSGYCGVSGPLDRAAVTGLIRVDAGEFVISPQMAGASIPRLDVTVKRQSDEAEAKSGSATAQDASAPKADADSEEDAAGPAGPALDMRVVIPRHFYIRGLGIDSEWQGDLAIKGYASAPALLGSLSPVRGYMDFLARTFTFTGGDIRFDGGTQINPILNLELTYENPNITALINAAGSAKKPKLVLDSKPPMPRDEILAHVLFGKNASELSRFEAIQLADSVRQLSGGGSATGFMGSIRKQTGLDMLRLGGSQGSQQRESSGMSGEGDLGPQSDEGGEAAIPALEAGKYITDSIYVGVEQGLGQESTAVRVEVELFPSVTLEGKSATEASEVGIGWKTDF